MLLAIDIGNSEITIGVHNGKTWTHHWRISSRSEQPEFFYRLKITDYFLEAGMQFSGVKHVVMSSVVPGLTKKIESVIASLFDVRCTILGPEVYLKLPLKILNPYEIGSDLVANAIAGYTKFHDACIIVDFGTALTFTTVSKDGEIIGVSIAPGLQTAIRALSQNTARLFEVPLEMPASALGRSTITAIQSGVLLGYEGLVKNVVESIRKEVGGAVPVIATGGLSSVITTLNGFFKDTEPRLTLEGLRIIENIINPD